MSHRDTDHVWLLSIQKCFYLNVVTIILKILSLYTLLCLTISDAKFWRFPENKFPFCKHVPTLTRGHPSALAHRNDISLSYSALVHMDYLHIL